MSPSRSFLSLAVVALLLVSMVSAPLAAADTPEMRERVNGESVTMQMDAEQNNTSQVSHKNPEKVNEDGNLGDLETYLQRQLASRLGQSSANISQGQYEQARSLVGDEYDSMLQKYVDVAGETGDSETAEQFQRAQKQQQSLAQTVSEYRKTYRAYQRAKQNGNQTRARELARKLERLSEQTSNQSAQLQESLTSIENSTSVSLNGTQTTVERVQNNVSNQQVTVRTAEFDPTTLEIQARSNAQVSFIDPLRIQGRLTTRNLSAAEQRMIQVETGNRTYLTDPLGQRGSPTVPTAVPVANRTVQITVGNRTYQTTTSSNGTFSLLYRPVDVPAGPQQLRVRYVPDDASPYLGSSKTHRVNIEPTNATIRITQINDSVAYGDTLRVQGQVRVGTHPVPELSMVVKLDGRTLGTVETSDNGTVALSTQMPARVPAGERTLVVQPIHQNRAVTATAGNTTLSVQSTPTTLSVNTSVQTAGTVLVSGQLQTEDGRPISGQSVSIRVAGASRTTVRTDEHGRYQATIARETEDNPGQSEPVTVTVAYPGRGNLQTVNATATLPSKGESASTSLLAEIPSAVGAMANSSLWAAIGALVFLGIGIVLVRRRSDPAETTRSQSAEAVAESTSGSSPPDQQPLLSRAQDLLGAGNPDAAVETAYAAARQYLAESRDITRTGTHWEFYQACRDAGIDADGLRELTQAYERAAYGRSQASADDARTALDIATSLLQRSSGDDQTVAGD